MNYGKRYFLFLENGSIRRLSNAIMDKLVVARTRLPEYAGQSIKAATVVLELDGRKPIGIIEIEAAIYHFDECGSIQRSLAESAILQWETHDDLKAMASSRGKL